MKTTLSALTLTLALACGGAEPIDVGGCVLDASTGLGQGYVFEFYTEAAFVQVPASTPACEAALVVAANCAWAASSGLQWACCDVELQDALDVCEEHKITTVD